MNGSAHMLCRIGSYATKTATVKEKRLVLSYEVLFYMVAVSPLEQSMGTNSDNINRVTIHFTL